MATVFVLLYSHREGVSASVYRDKEKALLGAAGVITTWIGEVRDLPCRREIAVQINGRRYERALDLWRQYQTVFNSGRENLEIERCELDGEVPDAYPHIEDALVEGEGDDE